MRIVSLLPAATEWVYAFGAASDLVGRSHECEALSSIPAVTRPTFDGEGDSAAIDGQVQAQLQQGLSLYAVDLEALRALQPDVILTQAQCEVCAVSRSQLDEALAGWTGRRPEVVSIQPMTLKQVLDAGLRIGRAIGRQHDAMTFVARCEERLHRMRREMGLADAGDGAERPTVACIEWLEPLMTAGHWMPDVVDMAGGRAVEAEKGAPSQYVDWHALRAADPDVLAVMPCGFTLDETTRDMHYLTDREGWAGVRAVREGRVVLFDGHAYFNRPGPRLYRSIELLSNVLHPDTINPEAHDAAAWEFRRFTAQREHAVPPSSAIHSSSGP